MLIRLNRRLKGQQALEECYYIQFERAPSRRELAKIKWVIDPTPRALRVNRPARPNLVEVGPRLSVETPFSSNVVSIFRNLEIPVVRVEQSMLYPANEMAKVHIDPLTQEIYPEPLASFGSPAAPELVREIRLLEEGSSALWQANQTLGLGMDPDDMTYCEKLFRDMGRNPTDVELIQLGNGNSEHSRHHFFRGIQEVDGEQYPDSLMDVVKRPLVLNSEGNLVSFTDNSGVIEGTGRVLAFSPEHPGKPSRYVISSAVLHPSATAETHNHPTLIAPFPGAATGAGGRIRDNRAVGRGGVQHAGVAGYATGNLFIPGFEIPGEVIGGELTVSHATPLDILIEGSNGVSDYSNKIGEPLIGGFTRTFGQMVDGKRREFRKPVLYTAGLGRVDSLNVKKRLPETGMRIVRFGGPAYRIGVGGGSASSMMHGDNSVELDLKSVQRGDPEMENRTNRVIQSCAELASDNPIESIHDQGAGGPSNVLTELMEPAGGRVDIRKITVGDRTMSVLEIWVAEFQEGYGALIRPENLAVFMAICERERVNCEVVGEITGDGYVTLEDSAMSTTPVHLSLEQILSDVPRKRFTSTRIRYTPPAFVPPSNLSVRDLLRQVLRLPQVGSKGFLVRKADRSVTGLVARQQCCGPMQVPIANAGVTADGYFGTTGAATAIGEQPIKMLIDPAAGARMAVAELLTNLACVRVASLSRVTCRANWMFAAKLPGEGAALNDAARAMGRYMADLGIKIDGGKDSLSMATKVGDTQVVSPGELVIMGYAPVPDITKVVTPDLKGGGNLFLIDLGKGKDRLGGSSLAQSFGELGSDVPDVNDTGMLRRTFNAVQELVGKGLISAYHDRSDGGLITALTEMCLGAGFGASIELKRIFDPVSFFFNEEAGMIFECAKEREEEVFDILYDARVRCMHLGSTSSSYSSLSIDVDGKTVLSESIPTLRRWWEETSTALELRQANPETVRQEERSFDDPSAVEYFLSFAPGRGGNARRFMPKVAVIREEGTNGDREMAAAFVAAGLDPWDITMSDILSGRVSDLSQFQGVAFPGGFSYADACGSARGWAAVIRFNPRVRKMFDAFYEREDTFTLGVCNGCQLMANIGWLPMRGLPQAAQPRFVHNRSGRFESRWSAVRILPSPSIFFRGMEGSVLGIHVAHGEGRLDIPDPHVRDMIRNEGIAPLAYVGPGGEATEAYPYNPNGSPEGWTALCSRDGRHLSMMPHPERCFRPWQWPWMPEEWRTTLPESPWLQMFLNARDFCLSHA